MIDTRITVDGKEVGAYDQRTIEQRVTKNEQSLDDIQKDLKQAITLADAINGTVI